jgi:hypothetical protein
LIPISTIETPQKLDLRLTWNEVGSEPTFVVPGLEHWRVQITVIDERSVSDSWQLFADIWHYAPEAGIPTGSLGRLGGAFNSDQTGVVLDDDDVLIHDLTGPAGGASPFATPALDFVSLRVDRRLGEGGEYFSEIVISAIHVPEPPSGSLILTVVVTTGLIIAIHWIRQSSSNLLNRRMTGISVDSRRVACGFKKYLRSRERTTR